MKPFFAHTRTQTISFAIRLLFAVLLLGACIPGPTVPPPTEHNLNFRMCVTPPLSAIAGPSTPHINGEVAEDLGWFGAVRYVFKNNGTSSPTSDVAMQAKHDSSNIYLSFEVAGDHTLDAGDLIILAIDADGTNANFQRLHVFPFAAATTGSDSDVIPPANNMKYWKGIDPAQADPWGSNQPSLPAGTDIKLAYASSASPNSSKWSVEMSIPRAAFNIVSTNYFGLYVDVIRTNAVTFQAEQFPWPTNAPLSGGATGPYLPEANTPNANVWGNATIGNAACNGVSISGSDIQTNHNPSNVISLNQANVFTARPLNNSIDASGNPKAASDVTATFRIRNYGISGLGFYDPVPVGTPLGTTDADDINANSQGTLQLPSWTLNATQQAQYSANPSQCMFVELNSTSPDTIFVNRSAFRNFTFTTTSSPFEGTFNVAAPAEDKLPEGLDVYEFLLTERYYNTPFDDAWTSSLEGAEPIGDGLYRLVLQPGEDAVISYIAEPPPTVQIPGEGYRVEDFEILPGTREPIPLDVEPGSIVTLLGSGSIELRAEGPLSGHTGPIGRAALEPDGTDYLLSEDKAPHQLTGALVASFDPTFQEGRFFVVGESVSLRVPDDQDRLYLAINDNANGYGQHTGEGYRVNAVMTPLQDYFLFTDSILGRNPTQENLNFPAGANLPKYNVCGQIKTGRIITLNGTDYDLVEDAGCFEVILTAIQ